ncbi:hypothetical protein ASZ90_006330 [hydrocarbon metagenome]|uniref:Uncharacterized protein n=1 Tax=hydrocarbon metagenome TaxID=938273 RepID=A0A0W8FSG0_9ZZZZ
MSMVLICDSKKRFLIRFDVWIPAVYSGREPRRMPGHAG